ncbi:AfsR/SARP family transcriptional regulator [Micromonospora rifamycinica]|uniref:DNA-binding transcriptional activator of the SARP family n=2 Tax=Micromonospora rifamycinica TaxID=291594 RepID=A0A1C5GMK1_9ACTN|nr:BTAD domain-containing putative transcriptional regulator [Micromonospora rifamycinica]SCG34963.1 DNA-binding transcriptional activator of the SARP family [Micromonospora rifamycinica]
MADWDFRLLGTVKVLVDGVPLVLGPVKQRLVLAVLVSHAGQVVSVDSLVDRVWERPPSAVRNALYAHISRIRRLLAKVDKSNAVMISRTSQGYTLEASPDIIDVRNFLSLVERARSEPDQGRRAALLGRALSLWRGPAMADLSGHWVSRTRETWGQQRLTAAVEWAKLETGNGHPDVVIDTLTALTMENPLAESIVAELMRALRAASRSAEAINWYARTREHFLDVLGVEPGPELNELHVSMLRSRFRTQGAQLPVPESSEPARAVTSSVPAQLPVDAAVFVGRTERLAELDSHLAAGAGPGGVRVVISGSAGVGKTALATHWAHRVRHLFPDGQLYINMYGYANRVPVRPAEALAQFVRVLGAPMHTIPLGVDELSALYRSLLADRRVLVVIDNVAAVGDVRPLLPAAPGCMVLVTSRNRLRGLVALDGAYRLQLDVLTPDDATTMFHHLLGTQARSTRPETIGALAAACAYLPLAMRIAAATIADRPGQSVEQYIDRLNVDNRLDLLSTGDDERSMVGVAFDLSYRMLPARARTMFCLLGVAPGHDISVSAAAALLGDTTATAELLLEQLVGSHLLDERSPGRFTYHDLLRLYARRQAQIEITPETRRAALRRLLDHYLHTADAAARQLYPQMFRLRLPDPPRGVPVIPLDDHQAALGWLDNERPNLVALAKGVTDSETRPLIWMLADTLRGYLALRQYMHDWFTIAEAGLAAACAEDSAIGQAAAHHSLAQACHSITRYAKSITHLRQALALSEQAGWSEGHTAALCNLGIVYSDLGELDAAVAHFMQALHANEANNSLAGIAVNLNNLGDTYRRMGKLPEAIDYLTAALVRYRMLKSPTGQAGVLTALGGVRRELGHLTAATSLISDGLEIHRGIGDRYGEATALIELSRVRAEGGEGRAALATAAKAFELSRELDDRQIAADAHNAIGQAWALQGDDPAALTHFEQARISAQQAGSLRPEAEALIGSAVLFVRTGRLGEAADWAGRALEMTRRAGYRSLERRAAAALEAARRPPPAALVSHQRRDRAAGVPVGGRPGGDPAETR